MKTPEQIIKDRIIVALKNTYYGMDWLTIEELDKKLNVGEKNILIAVANLASEGLIIVKDDSVRQKLMVDIFEEMGLH